MKKVKMIFPALAFALAIAAALTTESYSRGATTAVNGYTFSASSACSTFQKVCSDISTNAVCTITGGTQVYGQGIQNCDLVVYQP